MSEIIKEQPEDLQSQGQFMDRDGQDRSPLGSAVRDIAS